MIKVWIIGGDELVAKLEAKNGRVLSVVKDVLYDHSVKLQRTVKERKLSGQVLKVRTGTLRRSINIGPLEESGSVLSRSVGTNVEYAAIHEFGGPVDIPAQLRLIKKAFGRSLKYPVWVNYKARKFTMPERSFLRSALREHEKEFAADLEHSVARELAS